MVVWTYSRPYELLLFVRYFLSFFLFVLLILFIYTSDLVCLLLLFLREDEVYYASCSLIQKSIDAQWYFRASLHHHRVFVIGFSRLLRSRSADLMNHLESIRFDLNQTVSRWFERLFVSYVPFSVCLCIILPFNVDVPDVCFLFFFFSNFF